MQTSDILKIKGKTYEVWEIGENNVILRSLDSRHYFVTLHKSSPYLHLAYTNAYAKTTQPQTKPTRDTEAPTI